MDIDKLNNIDEDFVDQELIVHDENTNSLNEDLKNHSRKEAKYIRWCAQANRRVNNLNAKLEFAIAEVTDKICKEENLSPYQRSEVRRSRSPLDSEIVRLRRELNEAIEVKDYLEGLVRVWNGRGFRLKEIASLSDKSWNEVRVYGNSEKYRTEEEKMDKAFESLEK